MSENFKLGDEDVISSPGMAILVGQSLFKYKELCTHFGVWVDSKKLAALLYDGIGCQFLTTSGGGWRKGRFKICLEFIPDPEPEVKKPESPLDEFR